MKILKYIKNKFRKTLSVEEFADALRYGFQNMIENHSEFYEMLSKSGIESHQEDFKLEFDWELSMWDMFIITYSCRLILTNEEMCNATLDTFHSLVYNDYWKVDKEGAYTFQEYSKIRYKAYFKILRNFPIKKALKGTEPTSENPSYRLSKELAKNIYGKEVHCAITTYKLAIYITGSIMFATDLINGILRGRDLELKRN
jgi:hypothetical protein